MGDSRPNYCDLTKAENKYGRLVPVSNSRNTYYVRVSVIRQRDNEC